MRLLALLLFAVAAIPALGQRDTRSTISAIRAKPKAAAATRKAPVRRTAARRTTTSIAAKPKPKPAAVAVKKPSSPVSVAPTFPPGPTRFTGEFPPETAKQGDIWVNPKDGAELVFIPAGTFTMGDPKSLTYQAGHPQGVEQKAHTIALDSYWIYRTHVTVGMYEAFCRATGRNMPKPPAFNQGWREKRHPIVNVSWNDAMAYANWAAVTLPTEAQWERAGARAAAIGLCLGKLLQPRQGLVQQRRGGRRGRHDGGGNVSGKRLRGLRHGRADLAVVPRLLRSEVLLS